MKLVSVLFALCLLHGGSARPQYSTLLNGVGYPSTWQTTFPSGSFIPQVGSVPNAMPPTVNSNGLGSLLTGLLGSGGTPQMLTQGLQTSLPVPITTTVFGSTPQPSAFLGSILGPLQSLGSNLMGGISSTQTTDPYSISGFLGIPNFGFGNLASSGSLTSGGSLTSVGSLTSALGSLPSGGGFTSPLGSLTSGGGLNIGLGFPATSEGLAAALGSLISGGGLISGLGSLGTAGSLTSGGGLSSSNLGSLASGGITAALAGGLTDGGLIGTITNGLAGATSPVETPSTAGLLGQAAKLGGDIMKIKIATEANMANTGLGMADTSVQLGTDMVKGAVGMGTDIGKQALSGSTSLASTAIKGGTDLAKQSLDFINYVPIVGTLMRPVTDPVKAVLSGVQAGSNLALGAASGVGGAALDATKTGTNIGTGLVSGASSLGIGAGKGAINAGAKAVNDIIDKVVGILPTN